MNERKGPRSLLRTARASSIRSPAGRARLTSSRALPTLTRQTGGIEAIRSRTDWSSILRQRIRVLAWVRAGRPPLSKWHAGNASEDGS